MSKRCDRAYEKQLCPLHPFEVQFTCESPAISIQIPLNIFSFGTSKNCAFKRDFSSISRGGNEQDIILGLLNHPYTARKKLIPSETWQRCVPVSTRFGSDLESNFDTRRLGLSLSFLIVLSIIVAAPEQGQKH